MSTTNVRFDLEDFGKVFTITIGSGKEEKNVKASAALLSSQSFYFQRACSDPWSGTDKILNFPDERPETFEVFMAWLNTGNINHASCLQNSKEVDTKIRQKILSQLWLQLLHCYLMADYIQAPVYTNIIMDALIEALKGFEDEPDSELTPLCDAFFASINLVWDKTLPKSPLRKLFIDSITSTCHASSGMIQKHFSDSVTPPDGPNLTVPHTFILDILERKFETFANRSRDPAPWDLCYGTYHVTKDLPTSLSK
ncbi:hypothetical protein EYC80_003559 [Monilinia laxa]|uniref:BTB domain-containing protein n=1 Tax=Monilinia laxa TaxID=61186 RepID=A0A5N6KLW2_MONLA|nr:hypothetical protein EYC80_003559 [Monilinia laxa]